MKENCMTIQQYTQWLHTLSESAMPDEKKTALLPGIIWESTRNHELEELAGELFRPLRKSGLFPFYGEQEWVGLSCGSWEQIETMLPLLARRIVENAGLYGGFCGGVVLDLRWCTGVIREGTLRELERFLMGTKKELSPLILTAPGLGDRVRGELERLDLQVLVAQEEEQVKLKGDLEQMEGLTPEEKILLHRRIERGGPEEAAAILQTVRRMTALEENTAAVKGWLESLDRENPARAQRQIGFERS